MRHVYCVYEFFSGVLKYVFFFFHNKSRDWILYNKLDSDIFVKILKYKSFYIKKKSVFSEFIRYCGDPDVDRFLMHRLNLFSHLYISNFSVYT